MSSIGNWDPVAAFNAQRAEGTGILAGSSPMRRRGKDDDLVYQASKWHRYLWGGFKDSAREAGTVESTGSTKLPRWPTYMRELFTRFYSENPQRVESVDAANSWAEQAHELAGELPEFGRLIDRCMGDRLWSGMAATSIASEVLGAMPTPDEPLEDTTPLERQMQGLKGLAEAGIPVEEELQATAERLAQAQASAKAFAQQMDPGAIRQAMRRGCEAAQEQIDQAEQAMDAFGWGDEAGAPGRGGDSNSKRDLFKRVKDSEKLKALAELAGRMKRLAAHKQRSKTDHARDEVSDVTMGDDLARLLPSELAKLANEATRPLFYKALAERALLCYELKGTEPQSRGPIVVCIDNSGSMSGDSELWSKAVGMALLDIAQRQKRAFALIHFDTRVGFTMEVARNDRPAWEKVVEAMEYFSGGGTNFEPALKMALKFLERDAFAKADVILVTDGAASTDFGAEYKRRAQAKEATTYGVQIGGYGASALDAYCDHSTVIDDLENDGEATDALFTI